MKLQSGTDPPERKPYTPPIAVFVPCYQEWILFGDTWYSVEELERDNPFT